jgi:hypothetical protein
VRNVSIYANIDHCVVVHYHCAIAHPHVWRNISISWLLLHVPSLSHIKQSTYIYHLLVIIESCFVDITSSFEGLVAAAFAFGSEVLFNSVEWVLIKEVMPSTTAFKEDTVFIEVITDCVLERNPASLTVAGLPSLNL